MASAKWRPFCLGLNVLRNDVNANIFVFHTQNDIQHVKGYFL